jgi:hypothetical protein
MHSGCSECKSEGNADRKKVGKFTDGAIAVL